MRARGRRPVTDYGSTMAHWMRHREQRHKGSFRGEAERPSVSYIVDVSKHSSAHISIGCITAILLLQH